jgi:hypothetical protein
LIEETTVKIRIIKNCDIKLDGIVKMFQTGAPLDLPDDKARKLINVGVAELYTPSTEEYRQLVAYFGEQDPGGDCWEYIKHRHADLWARHRQLFNDGDLDQARSTYDEMLAAWASRNTACQPELLAA